MEFGSLSKLKLEKFHTMDGISLTYLLKSEDRKVFVKFKYKLVYSRYYPLKRFHNIIGNQSYVTIRNMHIKTSFIDQFARRRKIS